VTTRKHFASDRSGSFARGVDHAVDSMAYALVGLRDMERRHQEAFDAAVSAELVACALGQRTRPELMVAQCRCNRANSLAGCTHGL
jgi:hypothetical protein